MEPTEEEKARRNHLAAVRDANRQIAIIAALLDTPQEVYKIESTESTESDDESSLTPEEKAILADAFIRPTSDQLFEQVR